MGRGAWQAIVHGAAKSKTHLSMCARAHTHTHTHNTHTLLHCNLLVIHSLLPTTSFLKLQFEVNITNISPWHILYTQI